MSVANVAKLLLKTYRNYKIFSKIMDFFDNEPKQDELIYHVYNGQYYSRISSDPSETWYLHKSDGTLEVSHPPSGSQYAGSTYFLVDKNNQIYLANDQGKWETI